MQIINLRQQNCIVIRLDLFDINFTDYFKNVGVIDVNEIETNNYTDALLMIDEMSCD